MKRQIKPTVCFVITVFVPLGTEAENLFTSNPKMGPSKTRPLSQKLSMPIPASSNQKKVCL
jgi:hypothetical protein